MTIQLIELDPTEAPGTKSASIDVDRTDDAADDNSNGFLDFDETDLERTPARRRRDKKSTKAISVKLLPPTFEGEPEPLVILIGKPLEQQICTLLNGKSKYIHDARLEIEILQFEASIDIGSHAEVTIHVCGTVNNREFDKHFVGDKTRPPSWAEADAETQEEIDWLRTRGLPAAAEHIRHNVLNKLVIALEEYAPGIRKKPWFSMWLIVTTTAALIFFGVLIFVANRVANQPGWRMQMHWTVLWSRVLPAWRWCLQVWVSCRTTF